MATTDDVVLAYSYSGETEELLQLLPLFGRLGIPVIAVTGDKNSTLAEVADVVLDVAVEKEACPMNLTPTASSTASLAMGDALAIAVLEASGFREEDFARFHPGGVLGKRLRRVGDLMFSGDSVPIVRESAPLVEVIHEIGKNNLGMTCVANDGDRLVGIITDGDLRRALEASNGLLNADAKALMSSSPKTIGPGEMAEAALRIMEDSAITSLVVTGKKEKQILGVIHLHHILRAGVV
jgi:arabinose-5-phosphate isomerase